MARMKPVKPHIPVLLCLPELAGKRHSCSAFLMLVSRIPRGRVRSSRLGRIVATTAPGNRRIQREVAVNAPGLRPAASETGLRSNQPYSYIAEVERFYRKTRVFCMQVKSG